MFARIQKFGKFIDVFTSLCTGLGNRLFRKLFRAHLKQEIASKKAHKQIVGWCWLGIITIWLTIWQLFVRYGTPIGNFVGLILLVVIVFTWFNRTKFLWSLAAEAYQKTNDQLLALAKQRFRPAPSPQTATPPPAHPAPPAGPHPPSSNPAPTSPTTGSAAAPTAAPPDPSYRPRR